MVRSRRRKATQPEDMGQDRFRVSERQGGTTLARESRQSGVFDKWSRSSSRVRTVQFSDDNTRTVRMQFVFQHIGTSKLVEVGLSYQNAQGSNSGKKVSFYFTNFPEFPPVFRLRQQFEVCGILTNVFLARQRNSRGRVYGFARFSNVKNIEKLSQALNNIWYGHLRVCAREARFDRFALNDEKPVVVTRSGGVTPSLII